MIATKSALSLTALWTLLILPHPAPASAQNIKSYVSNSGSNANACDSVAHACATFQTALTKTIAGGEIAVVDTGDYGEVLIGQQVSISNDGAGEASMFVGDTPLTGAGIIIGAGVGDVVSLRGLVIDGRGIGNIGILVGQASAVHVQNCVIRNLEGAGGTGLLFQPSNNSQLFVSDSIIFNNGSGAGTGGIVIQPTGSGGANVALDRVHLENNVLGLYVDGSQSAGNGGHVVVRDSVVSGNAAGGILAFTLTRFAPAFLVVEHTSSVNNGGTGILANGPHATMLLDGTLVARNGVGISAVNGGQLISYGNNKVNNNLGVDGIPTGSYSPL